MFSFFFSFKIYELCNSEVLFSLNQLSLGSNWFQKTKTSFYEISWMFFSNTDFNSSHFSNFNLAHFETEESFGLIWVKLQNDRFHLQVSISGI